MYYVGKVICAPCNATCWGALCTGCGRCCAECITCGGCCCPEDRPSPLFLGFTTLLNLVPGVVFIVLGLLNVHNHCDKYVPIFFYVTAAINLFFFAFALHIYTYFSRPYDASKEADKGPVARACYVFWNDPWVAFFVLFFIGGFVWAIVGFSTFASADCGHAPVKGHYLPDAAAICATLLLIYILGSLFIIVLSLALECCRRAPFQSNPPPNAPPNQPPQSIIGRLFFPQQRPQTRPPNPTYNPGYAQTAAPPPMVNMVRPAPPPGYNTHPSQAVQMGYPVQNAYVTPSAKPGYEGPSLGQPHSPTSYAGQPAGCEIHPAAYGKQPAGYETRPAAYGAQPAPYGGSPTSGYTAQLAAAQAPAPLPPGYVPYDQVHGPYGREGGAAGPGEIGPPEPTAADKALAMGKRFAGNVGTGLKKFGAFVEEKASSHGAGGSEGGQSSSTTKR